VTVTYAQTISAFIIGYRAESGIKDHIINVETVVRYSHQFEEGFYKEPGMGLQFTWMAPQDQKLLQQFIDEEINKGIRTP